MLLWRAVEPAERADIEATGRFRLPLGGGAGHKYFAIEQDGAEALGLRLLERSPGIDMWLANALAPDDLPALARERFQEAIGGRPIEAVLLRPDDLRQLGPARIIRRIEAGA